MSVCLHSRVKYFPAETPKPNKALNIYYLALYGRNSQAPDLEHLVFMAWRQDDTTEWREKKYFICSLLSLGPEDT